MKGEGMTDILYMENIERCYDTQFYAKVIEMLPDRGSVVLDRTLFYAEGGGQPTDTGILEWDGGSSKVVQVKKTEKIEHILSGDVPRTGTSVKGTIDWERRYAHMKMHTSQHVLSAVVWNLFKSRTVGNQIHSDHSHIDFQPASFKDEDIKSIEDEVNRYISLGQGVTLTFLPREDIERRIETERVDLSRLPRSITNLRTVLIGENGSVDLCPCAGTHIRSLSELNGIKITRRKSKGSTTVRLEYILL